MRLLTTLVLVPLLAACATAPRMSSNTQSGMPEVTIATKERASIRENLLSRNAETGWQLEQESETSMLFTKTDESGSLQSAFTQVLIGNAYSTPPKYEIRYTLAKVADGIKVIANLAVSTQLPGGQVRKVTLNDNPQSFNAVQAQLARVKAQLENRP